MNAQHLSHAQQAAVHHVSTPTIITAGAGSGKTRTLTGKIAHLVNELGFRPEKILAITFTNKAAAEMKGRLEKATGRSVKDFPWVRTFHSACFNILKSHCELLGYRKPLLIHAESQQKAHLKKALAELDLDKKFLYAASAMISNAKNSGNPNSYLRAYGKVPRKFELFDLYNELLEQSNSVDFDDILLHVRDLLKKFSDIRRTYQDAFDYILIDEFQDTNGIQNEIVELLVKNGNLTVVGDDYQSIYKFRGADPRHFINFPQKYPDARLFRLEENYRSTAQIVLAADTLIANNSERIDKTCFSNRDGGLIHVKAFVDEDGEAAWIASKCREYVNYGKTSPDKIAILYRTKYTSLPFERALRSYRIPYKMVGAQGFFQRREVQDITAYLVCAVNGRDDVSFERIVNIPKRGIGPGAERKILGNKTRGMAFQEAAWKAIEDGILPKKASQALEELRRLLTSLTNENPASAIRRIVNDIGYLEYVKTFSESLEDFESRKENIEQMIYDASQKETIAEYLEDAALIRDDQDVSDSNEGVRLSTIHAAKGLEFNVVFVVALEEGILPHHRSLNESSGQENDEGIQEERRLMYVAMTRAADHLHLTWSMMRKGEDTIQSRFLEEIPPRLTDVE